jgi:hypothetical protein
VVDEVTTGQASSECFGFPWQFSLYQILHTRLPSEAATMGPLVAAVPSGPSLSRHHKCKTDTSLQAHTRQGVLQELNIFWLVDSEGF